MPTETLLENAIDPLSGFSEEELQQIWEDIEASYWMDINKSEPIEI